MSTADQVVLSIAGVAIAAGYFCFGRLWGRRDAMAYWQKGFDAAKEIYRPAVGKDGGR